jgi:hypothetical protein
MKIMTLLKILREYEADLAGLYDWLANVSPGDLEAAAFFSQLSHEKREHVGLFDYQRRLVRSSPAAFGEVDAVVEPIQEARELAARIRSQSPPPSLAEAVVLAWHFETSAAEAHLRTAIRQANLEVARLLDSLGKADLSHSELVESFARSRGIAIQAIPTSGTTTATARAATRGRSESVNERARRAAGAVMPKWTNDHLPWKEPRGPGGNPQSQPSSRPARSSRVSFS